MRKFDRLKAEAKAASVSRGHEMSNFYTVARLNPLMGVQGCVAIAHCANCNAWVRVETRPAPNGIEIGGDAVALDCAIVVFAAERNGG